MSDPLIRSLVAFTTGACAFPLILFAIFRAMFPVEATRYGNVGFWALTLVGATLAAIWVWFKPAPLWFAVLAGPLAVLAVLLPWVVWRVINAA